MNAVTSRRRGASDAQLERDHQGPEVREEGGEDQPEHRTDRVVAVYVDVDPEVVGRQAMAEAQEIQRPGGGEAQPPAYWTRDRREQRSMLRVWTRLATRRVETPTR